MKRQASPSDRAPVTRGSLPSRAGPSVSDPLSQKALQGKWNPLTVTTPSVFPCPGETSCLFPLCLSWPDLEIRHRSDPTGLWLQVTGPHRLSLVQTLRFSYLAPECVPGGGVGVGSGRGCVLPVPRSVLGSEAIIARQWPSAWGPWAQGQKLCSASRPAALFWS